MVEREPKPDHTDLDFQFFDEVGENDFNVPEPHKSWGEPGGFVAEALTCHFYEDLMKLLQLVEQIQRNAKHLRKVKAELPVGMLPSKYWSLSVQLENQIKEFNAISVNYPSYYCLHEVGARSGTISGDHVGVDTAGAEVERFVTPIFIAGLIELLNKGKVDQVKKCDYCGRWFIAFKHGQRFCESRCRKSLFEKPQDIKDRRNKLRRERYKLAKERETKFFHENGTRKVRSGK